MAIEVICIDKKRDTKTNNIVAYKLKDRRGKIATMSSKDLKAAIKAGWIKVKNLTLTSDNRLVDGASDKVPKTIAVKKVRPVNKENTRVLNGRVREQAAAKQANAQSQVVKPSIAPDEVGTTILDFKTITLINQSITKLINAVAFNDRDTVIDIVISSGVNTDAMLDAFRAGTIGGNVFDDIYIMGRNDSTTNRFNILVGTKKNLEIIDGDRRFEGFLSKANTKNKISLELYNIKFDKMYKARWMFSDANINKLKIVGTAPKLIDAYKMCYTPSIEEVDFSKFKVNHVTRTARMFWNPFDKSTGNLEKCIEYSMTHDDVELWEYVKSFCKIKVNLNGFDLSHVINAALMFIGVDNKDQQQTYNRLYSLGLPDRKIFSALMNCTEDLHDLQYVPADDLNIELNDLKNTEKLNGLFTIDTAKSDERRSRKENREKELKAKREAEKARKKELKKLSKQRSRKLIVHKRNVAKFNEVATPLLTMMREALKK